MTPRILAYPFHSLPPILHMMVQDPMSSYSKGAQGLSVFLRGDGIFTANSISLSLWLRQCGDRYAIRAGRNCQFLRENEETPVPIDPEKSGSIRFDFELPGSTHNFRLSDPNAFSLRQSTRFSHSGSGSLEILVDRLQRGQSGKVYYKPFYRREDFNDTRYSPVFSPTE